MESTEVARFCNLRICRLKEEASANVRNCRTGAGFRGYGDFSLLDFLPLARFCDRGYSELTFVVCLLGSPPVEYES
jgi:hypothetical protein